MWFVLSRECGLYIGRAGAPSTDPLALTGDYRSPLSQLTKTGSKKAPPTKVVPLPPQAITARHRQISADWRGQLSISRSTTFARAHTPCQPTNQKVSRRNIALQPHLTTLPLRCCRCLYRCAKDVKHIVQCNCSSAIVVDLRRGLSENLKIGLFNSASLLQELLFEITHMISGLPDCWGPNCKSQHLEWYT